MLAIYKYIPLSWIWALGSLARTKCGAVGTLVLPIRFVRALKGDWGFVTSAHDQARSWAYSLVVKGVRCITSWLLQHGNTSMCFFLLLMLAPIDDRLI